MVALVLRARSPISASVGIFSGWSGLNSDEGAQTSLYKKLCNCSVRASQRRSGLRDSFDLDEVISIMPSVPAYPMLISSKPPSSDELAQPAASSPSTSPSRPKNGKPTSATSPRKSSAPSGRRYSLYLPPPNSRLRSSARAILEVTSSVVRRRFGMMICCPTIAWRSTTSTSALSYCLQSHSLKSGLTSTHRFLEAPNRLDVLLRRGEGRRPSCSR